jgi:hypothetical protein
MQVNLPPPSGNSPSASAQVVTAIARALSRAVAHDEAAPRLMLRSPSGKTFVVTVSDDGVLSVDPFAP